MARRLVFMTDEGMKDDVASVVDSFNVGDIVTGRVVKIEKNQASVDVGFKVDAILPISELSSLHVDEVGDVLSVGDEVQARVLRLDENEEELVLSKRAVDADKAWKLLQDKYDNGEYLQAKVAEVVKGGLVVDLGVRGFIPASLVERHFVEDFSEYKGRELTLKIIEIDPEKNKLVLSAKAVQEEVVRRKREETFDLLKEGDDVEGTVQRLTNFGAFVDVGGVDGLVHISEIDWSRVGHPSDALSIGEKVKCRVLKVDKDRERISLSIKETKAGPWDKVTEELSEGDVVQGKVKRLVSFGAFVEVYPGVEGLVHISQISRRHIVTPAEVLTEGQEILVKILGVNPDEKRISLSIRAVEQNDDNWDDEGDGGGGRDSGNYDSSSSSEADVSSSSSSSAGRSGEGRSNLNVTLGDMYPELRKLK